MWLGGLVGSGYREEKEPISGARLRPATSALLWALSLPAGGGWQREGQYKLLGPPTPLLATRDPKQLRAERRVVWPGPVGGVTAAGGGWVGPLRTKAAL